MEPLYGRVGEVFINKRSIKSLKELIGNLKTHLSKNDVINQFEEYVSKKK